MYTQVFKFLIREIKNRHNYLKNVFLLLNNNNSKLNIYKCY